MLKKLPASAMLVLLLTFIVFKPVLRHGFVNLDDDSLVYQSPLRYGVSWHGIRHALNPMTSRSAYGSEYLPIRDLSYMLDAFFWELNPVGFHLTNLLLHLSSTLLVWMIARRCTGLYLAPLAAVLFGLHPLTVESVAWIASRKDLLAGFFVLTGIWLRLRLPVHSVYAGWLCAAMVVLAGLSKYAGVGLAGFLVLWQLRRYRTDRTLCMSKWPLPIAMLTGLGIVANGIHVAAREQHIPMGRGTHSWRMVVSTLGYYLEKMFFPMPLEVTHGLTEPALMRFGLPFCLGGVLILLVLLTLLRHERSARLWVGPSLFLVMLTPVSNITVQPWLFAERYAYLGVAGWALMCTGFAWCLMDWQGFWICGGLRAVSVLAILLMLPATRSRVMVWESSVRLWQSEIAVSPDSPMDQTHMGRAWMDLDGRRPDVLRRAKQHFALAKTMRGDYPDVWKFLARACLLLQENDEAMQAVAKALQHDPMDAATHALAARIMAQSGKMILARHHFEQACALAPNHPDYPYNLGVFLWRQGDYAEADRQWRRVLEMEPGHVQARMALQWRRP